jgi:serine/threonine-protein phosphatase 2A activator
MQQATAPWAKKEGLPLPPVSLGETTTAPWSTGTLQGLSSSSRGTASGGRADEVDVLSRATPHFPQSLPTDETMAQVFVPASKRITTATDLRHFLHSSPASDFLGFILTLNQAVMGKAVTDACAVRRRVQRHLHKGKAPSALPPHTCMHAWGGEGEEGRRVWMCVLNWQQSPCSPLPQESPAVQALLALLENLGSLLDDVPPAAHTLRYGNPAFR